MFNDTTTNPNHPGQPSNPGKIDHLVRSFGKESPLEEDMEKDLTASLMSSLRNLYMNFGIIDSMTLTNQNST